MEMIEVNVKEIAKRTTISVVLKDFKQWKFRLWAGMWVMKLAAWIMWVEIEFKELKEVSR